MNQGFERELDDLQQGFKRFAAQYPDLAASLDLLNKNGSTDPDVRYLVEAFCRITQDLSSQIEKSKYRHLDALLRKTQCIWAEAVPPSTVVEIKLLNPVQEWPVVLDAGSTFTATSNTALQIFNPVEIWPWEVVSARYTKGIDHDTDYSVMLELELAATTSQVWKTPHGIRIHVSSNTSRSASLVSQVLSSGNALYVDSTGMHNFEPDIDCNANLMHYSCHPVNARLRELLLSIEKYFFLHIPIPEWTGDRLKILLPFKTQLELPDLDYISFSVNCAPATALVKKPIDPIIHDGTRSVHRITAPVGWDICKVDTILVDDVEIEDAYLYKVNDDIELGMSEIDLRAVVHGSMWIAPQATLQAGEQLSCTTYPATSTILYNCTKMTRPSEKAMLSAYAIDVGILNAHGGELLRCIIDNCAVIANNWVSAGIKSLKFIKEEFTPFLTNIGWCNGLTITVSTPSAEFIMVTRVLLCILRHRAPINTAIGMIVMDEDGRVLVAWKPTIPDVK